ncbi:hypothetical protein [Stenotrophomonas oahuensis]|uniref:Transmembrane protein n=1 Tax=Stenotrophomonas oahuensis TaxID=3003271 RepID=A0ABY9YTP3_9GAMM|nr:hypothetical protein [Stenotrophomonas sp. A5586]WNH54078.1 hypothetical protein PDM29_07315 [Stenotrophomonas sp. A5586]
MDDASKSVSQVSWTAKFTLAGVALLLTTAVTAGGILLYWVGSVARATYLSELGVPVDAFDRTRESIIEWGAYSFFFKWADYLDVLGSRPWAVVVVGFATFALAMSYFWPSTPKKAASGGPRTRAVVYSTIAALVAPMISLVLMAGVVLVLGLPAAMGESRGEQLAQKLKTGACMDEYSGSCQELWRENRPIGKGAVISESGTRIAFFDACAGRTVVMDVSGTEIRSSGKYAGHEALHQSCKSLMSAAAIEASEA